MTTARIERQAPPLSVTMEKLLARHPGAFTVQRKLGEGAMGEVYLVDHNGRTVALKILLSAGITNQESLKRFLMEGQVLLDLDHPNILKVFEVGSDPDFPYLTCEYVEGSSLDQILEKEAPMPWERALDIVAQILAGLKEAHAHGIVHRDIKPSNVLVDASGRCRLADFGIAKVERANAVRTSTGVVMGTPAYMAPELVLGGKPAAAADIYSVGVVLYELLTNKTPHGTEDPDDISELFTQKLKGKVVHPSRDCPGIPKHVDLLVERAMFREPAERVPTAAAFLSAIDDCRKMVAHTKKTGQMAAGQTQAVASRQQRSNATPTGGERVGVRPPTNQGTSFAVPLIAGLAVFAVALGGFMLRGGPKPPPRKVVKADPTHAFREPELTPQEEGYKAQLVESDVKVPAVLSARVAQLKQLAVPRQAAVLWLAAKSSSRDLAEALSAQLAMLEDPLAVPALVAELSADPDNAKQARRREVGKRLAELCGPHSTLDPSDCPEIEAQVTKLCLLLRRAGEAGRPEVEEAVFGAVRALGWLRCPCTACITDMNNAASNVGWMTAGVEDSAKIIVQTLKAIGTKEALDEAARLDGRK